MQRLLLAGIVVVAALGRSADAAELARPPLVYQPPPVVVAPFNWTGCYLGANAGALRANTDWLDEIPGDPAFGLDFGSHASSGGLGGVQANCNYQVAAWVIGIMGDYDWTNATASNTNLLAPTLIDQTHIRSLASVTGRIGYAWDRLLVYAKGGGAFVDRDYGVLFGGAVTATVTERRGGWTAGIGAEYAFLDWLTGFVEYDYFRFASTTNSFLCIRCGLFASAVSFDTTANINVFKLGLSFTLPDEWDPQRSRSSPR
ncbi:MAG TPA: outer membrane beta-barrel protein [Xanthobacteraceae bacterium]|jgi:outer membrane immunogenic protein